MIFKKLHAYYLVYIIFICYLTLLYYIQTLFSLHTNTINIFYKQKIETDVLIKVEFEKVIVINVNPITLITIIYLLYIYYYIFNVKIRFKYLKKFA